MVFKTQKSPDFSQKVWLLSSLVERKWWLEMVVVFPVWSQTMSSLLHNREGFRREGQEGGGTAPRGEKVGRRVQRQKRNRRKKDLSPDVTCLRTYA